MYKAKGHCHFTVEEIALMEEIPTEEVQETLDRALMSIRMKCRKDLLDMWSMMDDRCDKG